MNILAIDYGQKNIGMAWCEDVLGVVLPYGVIKAEDTEHKIQKIKTLVQEERINKIIIGLPLGAGGEENENTRNIKAFGHALQKEISIQIDFVDERYTSQQADRMSGGDASRDGKAAMVILQSYLDQSSS